MKYDHKKLVKALQIIRPGSFYNVDDGVLQWSGPDAEPTESEITAGLKQVDDLAYAGARAAEYPPIGDQLDALWKGGAEAEAMKAKIDAVKKKFPKPN